MLRKELDGAFKQLQQAKEDSAKFKLDLEKAGLESKKASEIRTANEKLLTDLKEVKADNERCRKSHDEHVATINALKAENQAHVKSLEDAKEKQTQDQITMTRLFEESKVKDNVIKELKALVKAEEASTKEVKKEGKAP